MIKKVILVIVFVIIEYITILYINNNMNTKKEQLFKNANELILAEYRTVKNSFKILADTVFGGYINKDKVITPFANRDRYKLYKALQFDYNYLSSIGFQQIHFHLPNNVSFLRMHKPKKFGDDLTNDRYSVAYVNREVKPVSGFEMGKIIPGFRYVYPLYNDNGKHIGSIETSFGVKAFADQIEKVYDVHTHFLITKQILDKKVLETFKDKYQPSVESDDYMVFLLEKQKQRDLENKYLAPLYKNQLKTKVQQGIASKKVFSFEIKIRKDNLNKHKIVTFVPLNNIQKQHIGYFVVYHNSNELMSLESNIILQYIAATIILLLLFIFLYKQLTAKEILAKQIKEKTAQLQQLTVKLEEHAQELEEINSNLEDKIKIEVEKNAQQERKLANQSKQAALGDMIGNIAHQWRQPLSAITTATTGMQVSYSMGVLSDEEFNSYANGIVKNAVYLSQTIDDFRDFISSDKKFEAFDVANAVQKCLDIVNSSINNHKLQVITEFEEGIILNNYKNELQQCIINIFNNAKDALKANVLIQIDRIIFLKVFVKDDIVYIQIKDTAGGIPENIIDKVFEPYFTTKHQSQGTGLGLYMTHQIIVDSMHGEIDVQNDTFRYNDKTYNGALFTIKFKINRYQTTKGENNDNR